LSSIPFDVHITILFPFCSSLATFLFVILLPETISSHLEQLRASLSLLNQA